jgi:hypothetical protein
VKERIPTKQPEFNPRKAIEREHCRLDRHLATHKIGGYRQIKPRDGRLDIDAIAGELARNIRDRCQDVRLQWIDDFRVRVYAEEAVPATNRKTTINRRKKFRNRLRPDWVRVPIRNRSCLKSRGNELLK